MKTKLLILALLLSFTCAAQYPQTIGGTNKLVIATGGFAADSMLRIPIRDTVNFINAWGNLTIRPQDGKLYYRKDSASAWSSVDGGGGGTLSNLGGGFHYRGDTLHLGADTTIPFEDGNPTIITETTKLGMYIPELSLNFGLLFEPSLSYTALQAMQSGDGSQLNVGANGMTLNFSRASEGYTNTNYFASQIFSAAQYNGSGSQFSINKETGVRSATFVSGISYFISDLKVNNSGLSFANQQVGETDVTSLNVGDGSATINAAAISLEAGSLYIGSTDKNIAIGDGGSSTVNFNMDSISGSVTQRLSNFSGLIPIALKGSASNAGFTLQAGDSALITISVPGAAVGDVVCLGLPLAAANSNLIFKGYVSTSGTVILRADNVEGGASTTIPSAQYRVMVLKAGQ